MDIVTTEADQRNAIKLSAQLSDNQEIFDYPASVGQKRVLRSLRNISVS